MWVLGITVLLVIAGAATFAIARSESNASRPSLWDDATAGRTYTGITGTLAGFTIASAIFLSGQTVAQRSTQFGTVIGMLLIAFVILIGTALVYASIPGQVSHDPDQAPSLRVLHYSHLIAVTGHYSGISIAWLALPSFLFAIGLPAIASSFIWLLLLVLIQGATRLPVWLYRLTASTARTCLRQAPLAAGFAVIYRLLAIPFPELLPVTDAPFAFAVVAFLVVGPSFAVQTSMLWSYGEPRAESLMARLGDRIATAHEQLVLIVINLVWLSIAFPFQGGPNP